jgi:general secretion pathway protein K
LKGERGFALVITLLITALLVALTVEFVNEVFVDTSSRQGFTDGQQASLLAGSGMEAARKLLPLGLSIHPGYTSLADLEQLAKLMQIEDENGTIRVTAEEESGKLNINAIVNPDGTDNAVYRSVADRLFKKLGLPQELLDAVADWIDNGDVPRTAGAETPYYQTLKPPYGSKNGNLETLEELRLVKGFDAKTVERLRPYITVYYDVPGSPTTPININTAAKELLAALDEAMTDSMVREIIDKRKDTPFKNPGDLGSRVSGMAGLAQTIASDGRIMQQEKGAVYRILSQATVKETTRYIEAVVRLGNQSQILYWREY